MEQGGSRRIVEASRAGRRQVQQLQLDGNFHLHPRIIFTGPHELGSTVSVAQVDPRGQKRPSLEQEENVPPCTKETPGGQPHPPTPAESSGCHVGAIASPHEDLGMTALLGCSLLHACETHPH